MKAFDESLKESGLYPLTATGVKVFQVNVGSLCNLSCRHCHVEAGPQRSEVMSAETVSACLEIIKMERFEVVDITGGAPELNPGYRRLLSESANVSKVRTRTNLTILLEDGFKDMPLFWAERGVEVVASLPYYSPETADRQRGKGVFEMSVEALKALNGAGYGLDGGPPLCLVYNPCGAYLPPVQKAMEADFRREMGRRYGVSFTRLYTITNMPVGRFLKFLKDSGNYHRYMERLSASFNPAAARGAMCRETLSVGFDGTLHDCDFNQMLGMGTEGGAPGRVEDFDLERLSSREIKTGIHCYGCASGGGSSCTGAVA